METYEHDFGGCKQAFIDFLQRPAVLRHAVAVHATIANVREIMPLVSRRVVSYGLGERRRLRASDVSRAGAMHLRVARSQARGAQPISRSSSISPGAHNVLNALAAIAVAQRDRRRRCGHRARAGGIPGRRAALPALRRGRAQPRRHASRWSTTTAIIRRKCAATLDAARGSVSGPPARARLPAAPLYAHARSASRISSKCSPASTCSCSRRCIPPARRRSRPQTARSLARARPRRGARRAGLRRASRRHAATHRARWPATGDVVVTMGAGIDRARSPSAARQAAR